MNAQGKPTSDRIGGNAGTARYADFHITRSVALETCICRFPEVQRNA